MEGDEIKKEEITVGDGTVKVDEIKDPKCQTITWGGIEVSPVQFMELQRLSNNGHSWLQKNISAILAVMLVIGAFFMFYTILKGGLTIGNDNKDIVIYIVSAFTSIMSGIMGYYYGSSSNAAKKDETIRSLSSGAGK